MFNLPESSSQAMFVGGIHIPKNTMVMLNVVSLNRNQDVWQPDPLNFRPEPFGRPVSAATMKAYHGFGNVDVLVHILSKVYIDFFFLIY